MHSDVLAGRAEGIELFEGLESDLKSLSGSLSVVDMTDEQAEKLAAATAKYLLPEGGLLQTTPVVVGVPSLRVPPPLPANVPPPPPLPPPMDPLLEAFAQIGLGNSTRPMIDVEMLQNIRSKLKTTTMGAAAEVA